MFRRTVIYKHAEYTVYAKQGIQMSVIVSMALMAIICIHEAPSSVSASPIRATEAPPKVSTMCDWLGELRGPLEYVLLKEEWVQATAGGKDLQEANQQFRELASRCMGGKAPKYDEALAFFNRYSKAKQAPGEHSPGLMMVVDYATDGRDVLNTTQRSNGLITSHLLVGDISLQYQSALNRLIAQKRKRKEEVHFTNPWALVYPLNPMEEFVQWCQTNPWEGLYSEVAGPLSFVSEDTGGYGETYSLSFEENGSVPAVVGFRATNGSDSEEFVLTFFRLIPVHGVSDSPLGFYELIRLDSVGTDGHLIMQRYVVYDCERLRPAPKGWASRLMLPVSFGNTPKLQDRRTGRPKEHGTKVGEWPTDLLDIMIGL